MIFGSRLTYGIAEVLPAFTLPLSVVASLESLAGRNATWRTAELVVLGVIFATLFAAHRDGFIDRPFFLADPILRSGRDPLIYLLLLGLGLAAIMAVVLAKGSHARRSFLGFTVLLLGLVALFLALPKGHLKGVSELHRLQAGKENGDQAGGKSKGGEEDPGGTDPKKGKGGEKNDESLLPDSFNDQSDSSSDSPVAVVVFHGDYTPALGFYYFRETAFSTYNGLRVVQDATARFDRDIATEFSQGILSIPQSHAATLPGTPGPAFRNIRTTVALMAPHPRPFGLVDMFSYRPTGNPDPRRFFQAYEVQSSALVLPPQALINEEAGGPEWDPKQWAHYTEGSIDPRYGALVERIISELPPNLRDRPFFRAVAIKLWLDQNGTYTLQANTAEDADPVAKFLFGDLRGHCVHFAHAACMLYRAAGVPARVAGGYAAPATYRFGGASLLLRSRNAHAWPEIYLRNTGWIPLDISPAKNEAKAQAPPDQGLQQMLGNMAVGEKPPPDPPPLDGSRHTLWDYLGPILRLLGLLVLTLLALAIPAGWLTRLWRHWVPFLCRPDKVPRLAYRAALDQAARLGQLRTFGESRENFAARVSTRSSSFQALTALHLQWALGAPGRDPEAARYRALLKSVRIELWSTATSSRRWVAILDPFSWMRVH
ncbi:MAG: transglutaminase-like domain-containing protein [Holophagaceae bacterium]|nr:transglutaminase-like domain-containing protein [Holophagaceae bacterium]